jgi:hypothetical protein
MFGGRSNLVVTDQYMMLVLDALTPRANSYTTALREAGQRPGRTEKGPG